MAAKALNPLCFILMPFGTKTDGVGRTIDFDRVYHEILRPAVDLVGFDCIRADNEGVGGIIQKPMFERLVLSEYAIADLTTANANVYYELGIRHAVRPYSTVLTFAEGVRLPFDVGLLRGLPYHLDEHGAPNDVDSDRAALAHQLEEAQAHAIDSPLFQLLDGFQTPDISRLKTDVFRDRVEYSSQLKAQLQAARVEGAAAVRQVLDGLPELSEVEVGVVVDILLSFRTTRAYEDMVHLVEDLMGPALRRATLVREQYAFALNRLGRNEGAEQILTDLISEHGPSSETYGLLGRVYKDGWESALAKNDKILAHGMLDRAIDAYRKGFEADWRDSYPGINAVELMELREPRDPRADVLLPVVRYSTQRRIDRGIADYWDYATLLETTILQNDQNGAIDALAQALAATRKDEEWERESTAASLHRIREARARRGEDVAWIIGIEDHLLPSS
jgi:MAP3K TRAFs-binding domain